ncbi:uncharacterized protein LOC132720917 [Ruditapes philippinarum]|uniref:uncharacterized protein LOC132720917 n=1 Tax=Ruditapes philippinarum TaxID=129788 RepID=UPI00295C247B|nr:uncharacterized protein LOC132720917 [Ruditapes philippinarum]
MLVLPRVFTDFFIGNCLNLSRNVQDTVDEIKLEARNEHTKGWVIHAYIKVFDKWLKHLGSIEATFEQIEEAISMSMDAHEALELVMSIKRNPPMTTITPKLSRLVSGRETRIMGSNVSNTLQYMALYDDDIQGTSRGSREIYVRSSQKQSYKMAHCPYCSVYSSNEVSNCQETLTTVKLNKSSVAASSNYDDKTSIEQERNKKRKKAQLKSQRCKQITTEKYVIENAKQNLLLESMPIRQNDYELYVDFVIDNISKECHVNKKAVLSITHEGFRKVHKINTNENESLFIVGGHVAMCLRKEVYEYLAVYGNIARPKLLTYLKTKYPDNDNTDSETYLFLTFKGMPIIGEIKRTRIKDTGETNIDNAETNATIPKQECPTTGQHGPFIRTCLDSKESENDLENNISPQENVTEQPSHTKNNKEDINNKNESDIYEIKEKEVVRAKSNIAGHDKEISESESKQEMVRNEKEENKIEDKCLEDLDIQKELEDICETFFPTGEETYSVKNADNFADVLHNFLDQGLKTK